MEMLAIVVIGLIVAVIAFSLERVEIPCGGFNRRWPPIDDDEFIRRCHLGVNPDIALGVRRIVAEQLGVPYDQVYPEQSFVDDLGCN